MLNVKREKLGGTLKIFLREGRAFDGTSLQIGPDGSCALHNDFEKKDHKKWRAKVRATNYMVGLVRR